MVPKPVASLQHYIRVSQCDDSHSARARVSLRMPPTCLARKDSKTVTENDVSPAAGI